MTPTIYVERTITYSAVPDGMVTLHCQFTTENPFLPGTLASVNQSTQVAQPKDWTTDDQLLDALRAEFPAADVQWMPLPEPAPEPTPTE